VVGIVPLNPQCVIHSETQDDCATLAQSSQVSNPQRVSNTPCAVSTITRTAISLVTCNTPSSKKLKCLIGELNEGFQEAYAGKVLEEEAHRQYRNLVGASKRIKINDQRKLTEASTIVTAEVVFKLREEREKADALKASRKAKKLVKAHDLITTSTTPGATMPKRSSKQKKKVPITPPTEYPPTIPVLEKGDSDWQEELVNHGKEDNGSGSDGSEYLSAIGAISSQLGHWQVGGNVCSKCERQGHNLFYVDNTTHVRGGLRGTLGEEYRADLVGVLVLNYSKTGGR